MQAILRPGEVSVADGDNIKLGTHSSSLDQHNDQSSAAYTAGSSFRTRAVIAEATSLVGATYRMLGNILSPYAVGPHSLSKCVDLVGVFIEALNLRRDLSFKSIPPSLSLPCPGEPFDESRMKVQGGKLTASAIVHVALTPVVSRPLKHESASNQGDLVDEIVLSKALVYVREPAIDERSSTLE